MSPGGHPQRWVQTRGRRGGGEERRGMRRRMRKRITRWRLIPEAVSKVTGHVWHVGRIRSKQRLQSRADDLPVSLPLCTGPWRFNCCSTPREQVLGHCIQSHNNSNLSALYAFHSHSLEQSSQRAHADSALCDKQELLKSLIKYGQESRPSFPPAAAVHHHHQHHSSIGVPLISLAQQEHGILGDIDKSDQLGGVLAIDSN